MVLLAVIVIFVHQLLLKVAEVAEASLAGVQRYLEEPMWATAVETAAVFPVKVAY
jgi:hypothetical protein